MLHRQREEVMKRAQFVSARSAHVFEILAPAPIAMRPGAPIDYRIRVHGFPIRWRTEITEWQPPYQFVDVQRRGPYTLWHYTHTFEGRDGGTVCLDQVRNRPRGGALIHWLFVRRDVERIFQYRQRQQEEMFRSTANNSAAAGTPAP